MASKWVRFIWKLTSVGETLPFTLLGLTAVTAPLAFVVGAMAGGRVLARAKPLLGRALELMRKGIDRGRAVLRGLWSPALSDGSLEMALYQVRDDFASNQQTRLRIVILGQTRPVEPAVLEQLYLIAREALLSALRHSEASKVEAEIQYLRRKLRVVVRDNGTGIDPQVLRSDRNSHCGLTRMRESAASIGANIQIWSMPKVGTEVEISVPLNQTSRPNRAI